MKRTKKVTVEMTCETSEKQYAGALVSAGSPLKASLGQRMLDAMRRPARRTIAAFFLLGLFNNLTFVINSASAPSILPGAIGIVYIINCGALATRRPAPPPPAVPSPGSRLV